MKLKNDIIRSQKREIKLLKKLIATIKDPLKPF